jgi:hypothetical protein
VARNYPDWIKKYLEFTRFSEAPAKFHFWTAVSVIAGALRRRTWIDQGYFQWVPNFYIVFVSPPGIVSKSTTADIGMSLLRQVPGIKFGPNSLTWQSLTKNLAESTEGIELPDGEIYPMSALTIVGSELGALLNFEDREMIDVFTDLWDGKQGLWHRQTKTSGEDKVQNPFVNILGCTTPAWIRRNFEKYLLGQGFTSRCIFVYGHEKRLLEAYPGDRLASQGSEFADTKLGLIQDLEQIAMLFGNYELSAQAKAWGRDWYTAHYQRYKSIDPTDEGVASFLARKQTHIHKLGMILTAAKTDDKIIQPPELQFADKMLDSVEHDLPEIFGRIAERDEVQDAVTVLQILGVRKVIARHELFRQVFNRMSAQQFETAIASLTVAGKITTRQTGNELVIHLIEDQSRGKAPDPMAE